MKRDLKLVHEYLFYALCFFLPFEGTVRFVPNLILIILGLIFPFIIRKNDLIRLTSTGFILFTMVFLFALTTVLTNHDLSNNMFIISKLGVILGIYILYLPLNINKNIKLSLIMGVALAIIISIGTIFIYVLKQGEFSFSVGKIVNEILTTERVYLSFMAVLSFIFSLELRAKQHKKGLLTINMALTVFFILLVAAKMALISCVLVALYNLLFFKKYKTILIGFIIGIIVFSCAFTLNKNLQDRFLYNFNLQEQTFLENLKKWEPRIAIWNCAFYIYNQDTNYNKILGYSSFFKTNEELKECYGQSIVDKSKREWFIKGKFNTHNQFLDFLLSTGYIGLLLFSGLFAILFYRNTRHPFNTSLLLACLLLCLVENFFHRQIGVYLFAIILILISNKDTIEVEMKTENE